MSITPGDLGTRKRPGTSCKIEIHFWFKITQYHINDIRFLSQICPRHSFPCARHRHKVLNSFTKESGRDKGLKVRNWIYILLLVPVLLLTVRSPGKYNDDKYIITYKVKNNVIALQRSVNIGAIACSIKSSVLGIKFIQIWHNSSFVLSNYEAIFNIFWYVTHSI